MAGKKLVHIVDDEDAIRRSAAFMLKTSGYAVQTWSSGIEFLKEVGAIETGCVLLDVRMPGMDGLRGTDTPLPARGRGVDRGSRVRRLPDGPACD